VQFNIVLHAAIMKFAVSLYLLIQFRQIDDPMRISIKTIKLWICVVHRFYL